MKLPLEILSSTTGQNLGWALIHFIWQGAVVALAFAVAQSRFKSAQARYVTGCLALFMMVCCPTATFLVLGKANEIRTVAPLTGFPNAPQRPAQNRILNPPIAAAESIALKNERAPALLPRRNQMIPWIVFGWATGAALLSLRLLGGWGRLCWLRFHSTEAGPGWLDRLKRLQRNLGLTKPVALLKSAWVETPVTFGWIRPVILIPASVWTGLSPAQLDAVLVHELIHLRRHDFLVNLLQTFLETLLFYHPAVWWISRAVRIEREHCCDDAAIQWLGNPAEYARALVQLEELRAGYGELRLAAGSSPLVTRVQRILGKPPRASARAMIASWLVCAGLMTCILSVGVGINSEMAATTADQKANSSADVAPELGSAAPEKKSEQPREEGQNSRPQQPAAEQKLDPVTELRQRAEEGDLGAQKELSGKIADADKARLPQVFIQTKLTEVSEEAATKLGLNWFGPNPVSAAGKVPVLGDVPTLGRLFRTNGGEWAILSAILTSKRAKEVETQIKNTRGVDVLTAPAIVTLSGRQARLSISDKKNIVTGVDTNQHGIAYKTQSIAFGPEVEIFPFVYSDLASIQLEVSLHLKEFLGYADAGSAKTAQGLNYQIPKPMTRTRHITSSAIIYDSQTLAILGGEIDEFPKTAGQKPGAKKKLLILISARIEFPKGTPANRAAFDENSIPPQARTVPIAH